MYWLLLSAWGLFYDCSIGSHALNGMVGTITVVASSDGCTDSAADYDAM